MEDYFLPIQFQNTTTPEATHRNKWDGWEFFICLMPSYIFFILGFMRYFEIRHLGHPAKEPDFRPYHIIKWLSCGMSLTYVVKALLVLIKPSLVNQERDDLKYVCLYFFPIVSWYWAYWLTLMEVKRKVMPLDHNQLLLWVLSTVASFIKMIFEDKSYKIELCFDFLQFCLSGMTVIQYYKHSDEFLKYMEEFAEGPSLHNSLTKSDFLVQDYFSQPKKSKVYDSIPEVNIHLSKKIHQKKTVFEVMEHFFEIHVEINSKKLPKIERSLKEFVKLDEELKLIYNLVRFPRLSSELPEIDRELVERFVVEKNPQDHYAMIEHLEDYLNQLAQHPIYMHEVVLDFLKISDPHRKKFIRYFMDAEQRQSVTPKSSGHRLWGSNIVKNVDIEMGIVSPTNKMERSGTKKRSHSDLKKINLEVHRLNIRNRTRKKILYEFRLDLFKENDEKVCWVIAKSLNSFKRNHRALERYLGNVKIPALKNFLPEVGEEDEGYQHWESILIGLEKYLKTLLSLKKCYCPILFEFLGLDTDRLEPKEENPELKSGSSVAEDELSE